MHRSKTKKKKGPKKQPYLFHEAVLVQAWMVVDKRKRLSGSWGFYDDFHIFSSPEQAHWCVFSYYDDADPKDYRVLPVTITYDPTKMERPLNPEI